MMNDSSPFSLPESADETARRHHHLYEEAQSYPTEQPGAMTLDSDMIHSGETFGGTIDDDNHCNNDKAKHAARGFDLSQPANQAVVALCLVVLAVIAAIVVALLYATDFVLDRKDGLVPTPAPPVLRPPLRPSPRPSPRPSAQPFALVKWFRVGSDIAGETRYDRFGSALAMSSNGTVLAIGAPRNGGRPGFNTGHVRIFDFSGQGWVQRGSDLDGDAVGDYFGASISMSRDGSVVAVGAGRYDGAAGFNSGRVRVFVWDGSSWVARGSPLDGEAARHAFGGDGDESIQQSVSLSDDGDVVAVGAPGLFRNSYIVGSLRIFDWNGVDWVQRGSALLGAGVGDRFGHAVSVSSDGNIVACGAYWPNLSGDLSYVRVFRWTGTMWTQLGTDIQGQKSNEHFGRSLSLSGNGMVVAVGAPGTVSGGNYCRVFEFDGNNWVQLGQTLEGERSIDWFRASVSLSRSGDRLVVGSSRSRGPPGVEGFGHARVFRLTSNRRWLQQGNYLGPSSVGAHFGYAVAISDDEPSRVAIGVPSGDDAGWVRVYQAA